MISRACQQCGKTYETYPSIKPTYCSSQCAGDAKKRGQYIACAVCGNPFWQFASTPDRLYCSKSCATTARNRTEKNPSYHRDITGVKNPMYGKGLKGEANPMYGRRKELAPTWKGGRKIRRDGYVLVVAPEGHPYPADTHEASNLAYILEHRLVMEKHLGRYLDPEEVVHHKDKNPSNNSLDNLELFANQEEHMRVAHNRANNLRPRRRRTQPQL